MGREIPPQGAIIHYPYLWLDQSRAGESEGRKHRPVRVALCVPDRRADVHHLVLLAISSQPPRQGQRAIEVPATERRRGGLDAYPQAWVHVGEYNYDAAEQSFYYEPLAPILGVFSGRSLSQLAKPLLETMQAGRGRIDRSR